MGFEKFGKHGYVSQAKVAPIVDYLKKGELAGTKCLECGALYFPPKADCPKCRSTKFDWVPLNENCKLITFTEVFFAPPEFQKETPYLLGLAELEEGPRVFAPIDSRIAYGVCLLVVILLLPGGVSAGLLNIYRRLLSHRR